MSSPKRRPRSASFTVQEIEKIETLNKIDFSSIPVSSPSSMSPPSPFPDAPSSWIPHIIDSDIEPDISNDPSHFWLQFLDPTEFQSYSPYMNNSIDAQDMIEIQAFTDLLKDVNIHPSILINSFLNLKRPTLSDNLVEILINPGNIETMIEYITRPIDHVPINRDAIDIEAGKRAFNLVTILTEVNHQSDYLLSRTLPRIVNSLMLIFNQNSNGSFHHFRKILIEFLKRFDSFCDLIIFSLDSNNRYWVIEMLRYIHDPCIIDCLVAVIFHKRDEYYGNDKKISALELLSEIKFIDNIVNLIKSNDTSISNGAVELLYRVIEEARLFESSGIIFKGFEYTLEFTRPRQMIDSLNALFLKRFFYII